MLNRKLEGLMVAKGGNTVPAVMVSALGGAKDLD